LRPQHGSPGMFRELAVLRAHVAQERAAASGWTSDTIRLAGRATEAPGAIFWSVALCRSPRPVLAETERMPFPPKVANPAGGATAPHGTWTRGRTAPNAGVGLWHAFGTLLYIGKLCCLAIRETTRKNRDTYTMLTKRMRAEEMDVFLRIPHCYHMPPRRLWTSLDTM
jgi:hypothetical protein